MEEVVKGKTVSLKSENKKLKDTVKELKLKLGEKEKYTPSGVIKFIELRMKANVIRKTFGISLKKYRSILRGEDNFSTEEYQKIVKYFPKLENSIQGH